MERVEIKIGVTGDKFYENQHSIKNNLFKLKNTFGDSLVLVSRGNTNGADKHIKKFALELGIEYREFNPAHTVKNLYSVLSENFYGKVYSASNFFMRDMIMAKYIDFLLVFKTKDKDGKDIKTIIDQTKKLNKKIAEIV